MAMLALRGVARGALVHRPVSRRSPTRAVPSMILMPLRFANAWPSSPTPPHATTIPAMTFSLAMTPASSRTQRGSNREVFCLHCTNVVAPLLVRMMSTPPSAPRCVSSAR